MHEKTMDVIIASNNQHKIDEYRQILKDFNFNIMSLKDANITCNPEENGKTFMDNSLIKAKECQRKSDKIILADDSGLIVDSLPDILGVHTSRFLGEETPYPVKWMELIKRLKGKDRSARFVCCITILNLQEEPLVFIGECPGHIAFKPEGNSGFGYDPIFIPDGYDQTFASLGEDIKNHISHRSKASSKMVEYLEKTMKKGA